MGDKDEIIKPDDSIITPGDFDASTPKPEGGLVGADGKPLSPIKVDGKQMESNDEGLCAVEVLGRCSKCNVVGWIDFPNQRIPTKDIDRLLDYKPIKCHCAGCRAMAEFLPIAYKKYPDVAGLQNIQDGFRKGIVK